MEASTLTPSTVLKATSWCVVREQEDQYLVYNSRTDELHLLPPTGFFVYDLCNGRRELGEIERELQARLPEGPERLGDSLRKFCGMLLDRGIVEIGT